MHVDTLLYKMLAFLGAPESVLQAVRVELQAWDGYMVSDSHRA